MFAHLFALEDAGLEHPLYSVKGFLIDGEPSTAVLTAFKTCSGKTGTAIVFLADATQTPRVISSSVVASPARWASLDLISPATLRVFDCMECDSFTDFVWDGETRRLTPSESQLCCDEHLGDRIRKVLLPAEATPNNSSKPTPLRGAA
jgi:hypothetical protein